MTGQGTSSTPDGSTPDGSPLAVGSPPGAPGPTVPADTRRELRESRRQRRRTLWLCAGVLAVCLGLTVATVELARSRPVAPAGAAALGGPDTAMVSGGWAA